MASETKNPLVISELNASIQGIHFIGKIREKLKEFFPKHLDTNYYHLDKYVLSVSSGHIASMECVLKKNPDVEEDPFYQKELLLKLTADQSKVAQAAMDEVILARMGKKYQVVNNGTKPEIKWEQGTYTADDVTAIAVTFKSKVEINFSEE